MPVSSKGITLEQFLVSRPKDRSVTAYLCRRLTDTRASIKPLMTCRVLATVRLYSSAKGRQTHPQTCMAIKCACNIVLFLTTPLNPKYETLGSRTLPDREVCVGERYH